ncbi:MAG: 30S ribosomal protein S7 [Myxococcota bacterium]
MPRRREVPKREVNPDPVYNDKIVTKFMNIVMQDGKKAVAEKIVYGSFDVVQERTREDPLEVFHRALENCQPNFEVKSRRVGGATYQVPVEVAPGRRLALAMRWLVQFARKRPGKTMRDKLANELIEAAHNRGQAVKRREDVHRMAEANRAFAHYRW